MFAAVLGLAAMVAPGQAQADDLTHSTRTPALTSTAFDQAEQSPMATDDAATADARATPASAPIASLALGVWTSLPGESKDDFARRVGAAIYPFTEASHFEACGTILKETHGTRYRVAMVTSQSQIACMSVALDDPGFTITHETLHTHPNMHSFTPNSEDAQLRPGFKAGYLRYPIDGSDFSSIDYDSGAGYVVAAGRGPFGKPRVLYQNGRDHERDLGRLESYDLAQLAPDAQDAATVAQIVKAGAPVSAQTPRTTVGVTASRKSLP